MFDDMRGLVKSLSISDEDMPEYEVLLDNFKKSREELSALTPEKAVIAAHLIRTIAEGKAWNVTLLMQSKGKELPPELELIEKKIIEAEDLLIKLISKDFVDSYKKLSVFLGDRTNI